MITIRLYTQCSTVQTRGLILIKLYIWHISIFSPYLGLKNIVSINQKLFIAALIKTKNIAIKESKLIGRISSKMLIYKLAVKK